MGHRAHSCLSGPLHEGNALADVLTKVIALNLRKKIDKAKNYHKIHHQNAAGLRYKFHIPREALEKAMAPHSGTLDWKIPWTEEPGRLQSMGLLGVKHNCITFK